MTRMGHDKERAALIYQHEARGADQRITDAIDSPETVILWWCSRCHAIVCGPASRPWPASSLRSRTISSVTSGPIADGEVFGRLDRGSNAVSPSARCRATSRDTQPWETP